MPVVQFAYADVKSIPLKNKRAVKEFVKQLFSLEGRYLQHITYVFCSDEYLLHINRNHLQHDYYTDIITFDLSENKDETIGEVYISIDRVKENALDHAQQVNAELLRVIFHGALHLCGYRDKTKREITQMRVKEEEYLGKFGETFTA